MKQKTLYALVFVPIILLPVYLIYNENFNMHDNGNYNRHDKSMSLQNVTKTNFMENNFEQIGLEEFKKELENPEVILIDVRTPEELVEYGKIRENQELIVFGTDTFSEEILKLDKKEKYLLYCWHGNRSAVARDFMKDNGFSWVKDLEGGVEQWDRD